tara:strand:- start:1691 stop:2458 length:768 start_codon:yes stop_codon:yes gene_type:complete
MNSRSKRRKFGQNYLKDKAVLFEMSSYINPKQNDSFVEIGPGRGALTEQINKKNINILAVDIDEENISYLREKYNGPGNLKFVECDFLKFDLPRDSQPLRVVGNLPYNVSTQIILKLINDYQIIHDMHFLVQKEVATKINGEKSTKNWGKLALKISLFFESEILFDVPPSSFDIKPKVDSSFIRLIKKKNLDYDISIKEDLFRIIDFAFTSRRKNIKNNLKNIKINWEKINVDPNKRPEEISIREYIDILKEYNS